MDLLTAITAITERFGDLNTGLLFGVVTGLVFGFAAQRSTFCMRSAMVELSRGRGGRRLSIWMVAFAMSIIGVQLAASGGMFRPETARLMEQPGSWSGAVIGGLIFGAGMVMARGCSGRLVILASTGNLRSVTAGLIFAITVQLTLFGVLSPLRQAAMGLWMTGGGRNIDLLEIAGLGPLGGALIGAALLVIALWLALKAGVSLSILIFSAITGLAIALGWILTFGLSQVSFEPVLVESATFAAPSADLLISLMQSVFEPDFMLGLLPGVAAGAFTGALVGRELRLEGYSDSRQMLRSMTGGALMGFGGVLAGGCAIGSALTGTSIFNGTAWVAAICFFLGAWAADWIFDRKAAEAHQKVHVQR